ncbi:hypothetical protein Lalb_Chr11g0072221 [Lupinus albus]|uniref:Sugar phosphate transporter domain-containing protein n=1 Tax=Lupinus albus TaxID=3870 RepID=A0A6A4PS41_LUPAL|nr:hypothetical protein Lalb_Chr11g0072221 [Lupinus albus]
MESAKNMELPLSHLKQSGEEKHKGSIMTRKGIYTALSYMAAAVFLVMFNKAALSSYNFPFANLITLCQMVCAFSILYVTKTLRIISFTTNESQNHSYNPARFVSLSTLAHTLPLALIYMLYMSCGYCGCGHCDVDYVRCGVVTMEAVRRVNVPMYTTLRRTTVAFTMIVEYFVSGQRHSTFVVARYGI